MASERDVKKFNLNRLAHATLVYRYNVFPIFLTTINCNSRDAIKNTLFNTNNNVLFNYHKGAEMGKRSHSDFVEPGTGKTQQVRVSFCQLQPISF